MYVCALSIDLHLDGCRSLKEKRARLRPVVEKIRKRFGASVAEVDHHDLWQRATIGIAVVGPDPAHVQDCLDEIERFVWAQGDVEVAGSERRWIDRD